MIWNRVILGLGFAALVALWAYAGWSESQLPGLHGAKIIEMRLKNDATQALNSTGVPWAKLEMDGQTATLSGTARTDDERQMALNAVRQAGWPQDAFRSGPIHLAAYYLAGAEAARRLQPGGPIWGGVVDVVDKSVLAPAQSPYVWKASIIDGRRLVIEGFAPSEIARAELLKQAQSLFPSGVDDQSTVARGVPKGNWTAAVSWALGSLERLNEDSELHFIDTAFTIRGKTDNPALPNLIKQRASQALPPFQGDADITLSGEQVPRAVPPAPVEIAEFSWTASLGADRRVVLTGYAPSDAVRADILQAAQTEFPAGVEDRTLIGTALPSGDWPAAARWALRLISKLDSGEAAFKSNQLLITGTAARPDIQTLVTNGARQIGEPYAGTATILLPGEPAPVAPEPTSPEPTPPAPKPPEPEPEPPQPDLSGPQEAEAANRSAAALKCQGIVDSKLAGQIIEFDSGRAAIKASSFALLDAIADTALKCPGLMLIVSGHTDNSGQARQNKTLSMQRARAVVAYLRNKGVANGRMTPRGYGAERPISSNDTEEGKARNRRIQITVTD